MYLIPLNMYKDKENFYITASMPGYAKEDIYISVENDKLKIEGKRKESTKKDYEKIYEEFYENEAIRTISLENVDYENTSAEYKDGILNITIPKLNKTHKIMIN